MTLREQSVKLGKDPRWITSMKDQNNKKYDYIMSLGNTSFLDNYKAYMDMQADLLNKILPTYTLLKKRREVATFCNQFSRPIGLIRRINTYTNGRAMTHNAYCELQGMLRDMDLFLERNPKVIK